MRNQEKKGHLAGILSGLLLVCVLVGNAVFMNLGGQPEAVRTGAEAGQKIQLPVLMYHHILESPKRWGDYVISPDEFESDLKYIKENGYTTISTQQLLDYYQNGTPLPEKPIMITFDDGYESTYQYAFPLLQKYEMRAIVSIIGKYTDLYSGDVVKHVSYSHLNWTQINEMMASGWMEIGNHTYELHKNGQGQRKGIKKLSNESDQQYRELLIGDVGALNQEINAETGVTPFVFAYPFGSSSKESEETLKEIGFKMILTCEEKVNMISRDDYDPNQVIKVKRFNRPSGVTSKTMFQKMAKTVK